MSSIFGIHHLDRRPLNELTLAAMRDALAHRDQDGSRLWRDGATGMGHRALHTTPESIGEPLPLVCGRTGVVLTADARIDNRRELMTALGVVERPDQVIRDSDLILAAYLQWGEQASLRLIGDFAFALWDPRHQLIFCARDPMGIRPLYYHFRAGKHFVFASAIRSVLASGCVERRLNESKIADYLEQNFDDTPATFYQEIFRLPAAHSLSVTADRMLLRRYWSLDPSFELRLRSDDEYTEAFREHFMEAVRCRTRSAFPVGTTLSGGLDSSSIACAASIVLPQERRPLRSFSLIFPGRKDGDLLRLDERDYIDAVLRSRTFQPFFIHADELSPLGDWTCLASHLDEACLAPNVYLHWAMYKSAAANGVRVLLDGIDGDTTVSHGMPYLTELLRAGRLLRFKAEARAFVHNHKAYSVKRLAWSHGVLSAIPNRLVRALSRRDVQLPVIGQQLTRRVAGRRRPAVPTPQRGSYSRKQHWSSLNSPLLQYIMDVADPLSNAVGVEVRYPFFDRRLIEFCLALPSSQKFRNGWTRAVLRHAMEGVLPTAVQWRNNKADLGPNFRLGLVEKDKSMIASQVTGGNAFLARYVDSNVTSERYRRWVERPDSSGTDGFSLFLVATLGLWLIALDSKGAPYPPTCD